MEYVSPLNNHKFVVWLNESMDGAKYIPCDLTHGKIHYNPKDLNLEQGALKSSPSDHRHDEQLTNKKRDIVSQWL